MVSCVSSSSSCCRERSSFDRRRSVRTSAMASTLAVSASAHFVSASRTLLHRIGTGANSTSTSAPDGGGTVTLGSRGSSAGASSINGSVVSVEFGSVATVVEVSSPPSCGFGTDVDVAAEEVAAGGSSRGVAGPGSGTVVPPPEGAVVGATVVEVDVDVDRWSTTNRSRRWPDSCAPAGPDSRATTTTRTHTAAAALVRSARCGQWSRGVSAHPASMPSWHSSSRENIGFLFGTRADS